MKEVKQRPNRGRLSGAVRPKEALYLALIDRDRNLIDPARRAVALGQSVGLKDCWHTAPNLDLV
jgi:hypothetical protein